MNFRDIFWLVLAVLVWGFLHSLMASLQFKAFLRRTAGPRFDRYYRLTYNIFSIISFAAVLAVAIAIPDQTLYVVPFPWVILMILGELAAVAALLIAFRQTDMLDFIGVRQILGPRTKQGQHLVTNGLYAYVRHPLYSAGLLFIWLFPLMTARLLVINIAITVYVVTGAYFEESKLRHRFGQEYVEYSSSTPMFIPFIRKLRDRLTL